MILKQLHYLINICFTKFIVLDLSE